MSFACVAFRVNFANVRFTDVKRGFASIYDVEVLLNFIDFLQVFLFRFCMYVSIDLGAVFGRENL